MGRYFEGRASAQLKLALLNDCGCLKTLADLEQEARRPCSNPVPFSSISLSSIQGCWAQTKRPEATPSAGSSCRSQGWALRWGMRATSCRSNRPPPTRLAGSRAKRAGNSACLKNALVITNGSMAIAIRSPISPISHGSAAQAMRARISPSSRRLKDGVIRSKHDRPPRAHWRGWVDPIWPIASSLRL